MLRREGLADQDVRATSRYAPVDPHREFYDLGIVLDHLVRNEQVEQRLEAVVDIWSPGGQPEGDADSDGAHDFGGMRKPQLPTRLRDPGVVARRFDPATTTAVLEQVIRRRRRRKIKFGRQKGLPPSPAPRPG